MTVADGQQQAEENPAGAAHKKRFCIWGVPIRIIDESGDHHAGADKRHNQTDRKKDKPEVHGFTLPQTVGNINSDAVFPYSQNVILSKGKIEA